MEQSCSLLIHLDKGVPPTQQEIQKDLESGKVDVQIQAMKHLIMLMLNGESFPGLLMAVIRFVAPSPDHELKKLALLYYETVSKYDEEGKLLPETILICNALLTNLKHPNEFIRAYTLRFICRVNESEIIEPLLAAITENLEHRHSLCRRCAVMAIFHIAKEFGDDLLPDADELIEKFIQNESDSGARRNAFLMLYQCNQDKAIDFFAQNLDAVTKFGDGFQLVILELTRRVCRADPSQKSRFIKIMFQLLQSNSSAVCYEAAWTLVSLSSAPTAVRAAAQTYTQLLNSESDTNVKLIVLDKLEKMKTHHSKVLQELLMDILRALNSSNASIQKKTLQIVMELISPRNVSEVMLVLKKEVVRTQSKDVDKTSATEYRAMLVKAIRQVAVKFASVADTVVHLLMDFLSTDGAQDVILFVREIVEIYPKMRKSVVQKLIDVLTDIKVAQVYRVAFWILGEYSQVAELQEEAVEGIYECFGELPFVGEESGKSGAADDDEEEDVAQVLSAPATKVTVLADGTYATQTAFAELGDGVEVDDDQSPVLRRLMLAGNYLLGASAVASLTKIILRLAKERGFEDKEVKDMSVKLLMYCCSMIQAGQATKGPTRMDKDSYERISFCMRVLLDPTVEAEVTHTLLNDCRDVFIKHIEEEQRRQKAAKKKDTSELVSQPDSLIMFRQLRARRALGADDIDLDDEATLTKASGLGEGPNFAEQLANVYQLTGFSDPVYAETQLFVHDFDISLTVLVINRTDQTLSNLTVEINCIGDLKVVERPQSFNIGPHDYRRFKANIKVSSTETGSIFGSIVYDTASGASSQVINLNPIAIDVIDYIVPSHCSDSEYRTSWSLFEWENKVHVNTQFTDVDEYLDNLVAQTNMAVLTPRFKPGESNFLAANLYARSVFGEDALVNVSIEKTDDDTVTGFVRIRAKMQGVALSIGDRITSIQKGPPAKTT